MINSVSYVAATQKESPFKHFQLLIGLPHATYRKKEKENQCMQRFMIVSRICSPLSPSKLVVQVPVWRRVGAVGTGRQPGEAERVVLNGEHCPVRGCICI